MVLIHKGMSLLQILDRLLAIAQIGYLIFWFLSKTQVTYYVLYDVFYELFSIPGIVIPGMCSIYFLIRWIMVKFHIKSAHLYLALMSFMTYYLMYLTGQII